MALQYNNTPYNILISYEYLRKSKTYADYAFQLHKDGVINLMVDSGAFSVFQKKDAEPIKIDDYCSFLKDYRECCDKYVMLDVIGDQKATELNYKKMIKLGTNPMFVATFKDKDLNLLEDAISNNPKICVAGGFTTKGQWMKKRFQDVFIKSNNKAQIHGLAYVNFKDMYKLPLASVDSSSWLAGTRYGTLSTFIKNEGIKNVQYNKILTGKVKLRDEQKRSLSKIGILPKHLKDKKYTNGGRSCLMYSCTHANIQYQEYSKRQGLDYFLAVSGKTHLQMYVEVIKNREVKYEDWSNK